MMRIARTRVAAVADSARPLRVTHVVGTFHVGGLERLVLDLCVGARERGIDARAVAILEDGQFRDAFQRAGIVTEVVTRARPLDPTLPPRLALTLRRWDTDVVHAHHFGPYLYGSAAAAIARRPIVYTEHSREVYDSPRRRRIARFLGRRSAAIASVSNELKTWREQELGETSTVILNGVALPSESQDDARAAARDAWGVTANALVVGVVARFMPEKDHATLVRAFARLHRDQPTVTLVLVGGGPLLEETQRLVTELGVADAVRFLGPRYDVEALLPGFDVIALSSVREGLPLALLEGMASGLPVVATDVGEIATLVTSACGEVVPAGDVAAFARALAVLALDADRRRTAGRAARARVEGAYSRDGMVDAYVALYRAARRRGR